LSNKIRYENCVPEKKKLRKQRENFRRKVGEEWRLNRYYRRKVKVRSELSSKWQSVEQ